MDLLSCSELSVKLGISKRTIKNWRRNNKIGFYKGSKELLYNYDEVIIAIQEGK